VSKDFLTYNQQMKYLRNNKKILCSGTNHKSLLISCGYFNLINGYKTPFSVGKDNNGHHIYRQGTSVDEIYALKLFDDNLRILLFTYITKIEQELRALSAYTFDNINKNNSLTWFNVTAYDTNRNITDIVKLISKIYSELSRSKHEYVKNYLDNHQSMPTWIMIKVISFSNLIDFIDLGNCRIKDNLCSLYQMIDQNNTYNYKLLIGSMQWLRKIRNSCAHNERVYNITLKNQRINDSYFDLMSHTYNNNRNRDKKIIDAVVYFKYYLPHKTFEKFINDFKKMLLELQNSVNMQSFEAIRASLGIKNINHLDLLLNNPKQIMYNSHT